MSSDKARQEREAPQDDNATNDEHVQPPQSLALRRGMAPLQVSLAEGTHQAAPRVTPSTTASSVAPFSFLPYGPYHPHMLSPMPHPSPQIPMSLELTLAIGRAAIQRGSTRNDDEDAIRDALARHGAVLPTPQTIEIRNSSEKPEKQQDSVAGEQKESVSSKSSAAVAEPKESLARMPQPSTAVGRRKAAVASMPKSSSVVDESVASVCVAEKEDFHKTKEKEDSKKAAVSTKPTRTSPRKTRSRQTPPERSISSERSSLSSSQRRKERKDMPIIPGGGVVTITPLSPMIRPIRKKQKRKK